MFGKDIIMRNVLLLAVIGFCSLFTGCGAIKSVANTLHNDICVTNYNKFVCTNRQASEAKKPAPRTRICYGVSVRTTHGVTKIGHTNQGAMCKKLQNETTRKAFESKPGTNCSIEGKGKNQRVVCAGFDHPALLLVLFFFLLARLEGNKSVSVIVLTVMGCLVASFADAAPKATYGGCTLLSSGEVYEAYAGACTPGVLESLIEEVGLVCTQEHMDEGASLSGAAAAGGLLPKADLRLRFVEALCWSDEAGFGWTAVWFFLLGLVRRQKAKKATYMVPCSIKKNAIIQIAEEEYVLDCHLIIFTILDPKKKGWNGEDKVVGHYFSATSPDGRRFIKTSYKGYYQEQL
tara:strand:+ start:182 stop:1222 length:1041 start_codon:yes stop_codon:yes gene_type:complete